MGTRQRLRATVVGALSMGLFLGGAVIVTPNASADTPATTIPVSPADTIAPTTPPATTPPVTTPPPTTTPPTTKPPVVKPPIVTCKRPAIPGNVKPYPRFFRETTKPGMRDGGVFAINHVREAQYRLSWGKYYRGKINGRYDVATTYAVKRFQAKNCLKVTGVLDRGSWAILIQKTIRNKSAIPKACRAKGWNSCYDRSARQDLLYRDGVLWNAWMVRGGMKSAKTRTGTYTVRARYTSKISSIYGVRMYYFMPHSGGQGQHGSGFMIDPFVGHSHGCINMYIKDSKVLFNLTKGKKLRVTVYGRWA